jgi:hypothetical protein
VRLKLAQEFGQRLVFDVSVVNAHGIATALGYRAQIRQRQVR